MKKKYLEKDIYFQNYDKKTIDGLRLKEKNKGRKLLMI